MHLQAYFFQVILLSNSMHHINRVPFTAPFCKLDTQLEIRLESEQPNSMIRKDHSYFLAEEF